MAKNGHQIKSVYGTQRKIRHSIDDLVAQHKPVFDVTITHAFLFWYVAIIKTDKALTPKHR